MMKINALPWIISLTVLTALSCSESVAGRGSGSEGESYVHGVAFDSLEMHPLESSLVVLAKFGNAEDGYPILWADTALSRADGSFSLFPPDSGSYSLLIQWRNHLHAHWRGIHYEKKLLDLGTIGLYRKLSLSGSFTKLPACASTWSVFIAEQQAVVTLDSSSAFADLEASPGKSALVLSCGPAARAWNIILAGACPTPQLPPIDWSASANRPIVINADCQVNWVGAGAGPAFMAPEF